MFQLRQFVDSRCLIENEPAKGLKGEKCLGSTPEEIKYILCELQIGFCLDFGHAINTANTLKKEPLIFIKKFTGLKPSVYHLTDGNYSGEYDSHDHYGQGSFPIKELVKMIPPGVKITNEAKHGSDSNLDDFKNNYLFFSGALKDL